IIGIVTFFMSFFGMKAGEKLYDLLEDKVEYAGGIILILIGISTLLEHLN
ncbi:MAG: manganese efflux pump, partial [Spirochaetaceae bacterium]|nr:manganese efflux pump [Spirochaetaceae bacterium]MCF7949941.1 manganese efflux pump [Spirochaetia bacterium]MCF7952341.1 manganese efflux pump [Spirochaetaceae bacterium]